MERTNGGLKNDVFAEWDGRRMGEGNIGGVSSLKETLIFSFSRTFTSCTLPVLISTASFFTLSFKSVISY